MSSTTRFIITCLLIFLICAFTFGGIHYAFLQFSDSATKGAISESVIAGSFFGIFMVAITLITQPKKKK